MAINCALSEYTPSAHGLLRGFTARPRRALCIDCVHKTFFSYWKESVNLYGNPKKKKKPVKNDTHEKNCFVLDKIRYIVTET